MNPGELNTKIVIQKYTTTTNDNDFPVEDWVDFKPLWVAKIGLSDRVFYQAAQNQSENDVTFKSRYVKGITAGMRVLEGNNIYEVEGDPIDKTGKKKEMFIHCKKVTPSTSS